MKFFKYVLLIFLIGITACQESLEEGSGQESLFRHHTVSTDFPEAFNLRYGMPAMADFDNDQDLDFALAITRGDVFLFEMIENYSWKKHKISELPTGQLAGGAMDIDRDGWMDLITGGFWFRNMGNAESPEFERMVYDTLIDREIHDIVFRDMDQDGKRDLIALGDKEGCFWYKIPDDPVNNTNWEKNVITLEVLDENADIHGGFFPGGVGDLDNDGDHDVVLVGRWYENQDKGKTWIRRFLPFGSSGYWGLSGRSWIVDMDKDGDNDIVMVSCDQKDSRGVWLEYNEDFYLKWIVHLLPMTHPGRRGSFHSLWVADFDLDGDWDIFTMDQEDDTILPENAPIRAYLWENIDGKGKDFRERIILNKNIGGHDVMFGDADGDGDLDAYFKVWSNYRGNGYQGKAHVDFLENVIK